MKRYTMLRHHLTNASFMEEDAYGCYVKYADVAPLIEALRTISFSTNALRGSMNAQAALACAGILYVEPGLAAPRGDILDHFDTLAKVLRNLAKNDVVKAEHAILRAITSLVGSTPVPPELVNGRLVWTDYEASGCLLCRPPEEAPPKPSFSVTTECPRCHWYTSHKL